MRIKRYILQVYLHEIADEKIVEIPVTNDLEQRLPGHNKSDASASLACCAKFKATGFTADRELEEINVPSQQLEFSNERTECIPLVRGERHRPIVFARTVGDLRLIRPVAWMIARDLTCRQVDGDERFDQPD